MVHGILSASLFMGGAMILSRLVPPTFKGFSIVGAAFTVQGVLLDWRLVRAMKKSGEL